MLTNIVLVIPTLAVLIIVAAYLSVGSLEVGGAPDRAHLLALGGAGDPGADVLARLARVRQPGATLGPGPLRVIVNEIAPNMSSYLFLTFILLFGGSVLIAATLDFLGLGPSRVMSLGLMMNNAVSNAALQLGMWWWFIPPGIAITAHRRRPLRDERRPGRGLQPEAAATREPRGRQPAGLLPHPARAT